MKIESLPRPLLYTVASMLLTGATHAMTILVDYDDGIVNSVHNTAVRNGGFETAAVSGGPPLQATFTNTGSWVNRGSAGQSAAAVIQNNPRNGLNRGVGSDNTGVRMHVIDTGYDLLTGDIVNFSFFWRDGSGWEDPSDRTQFTIFTTVDNTFSGALDQSSALLSALSAVNDSYQEHAGAFNIGAAMNGKRLFIGIDAVNGGATTTGFFFIEDVYVDVAAVPETSAMLLGGLGMLALLRRRR